MRGRSPRTPRSYTGHPPAESTWHMPRSCACACMCMRMCMYVIMSCHGLCGKSASHSSSSGFVIFSENTPFSFLFSFSVGKFSGRKFSGSPSSTALIVVLLVQPAPEEEDLTKEGEGEQRWLLHVLYTVLSLRK